MTQAKAKAKARPKSEAKPKPRPKPKVKSKAKAGKAPKTAPKPAPKATAAKKTAKKTTSAKAPAAEKTVKEHKVVSKQPKAVAKQPVEETVATPVVADTSAAKIPLKSKMLPREFLVDLAAAIREAVLPFAKEAKGREIIGQAVSGDATFEIDRIAEKALVSFLKQAKMPIAYYSEDEGYATFSSAQPENLLVVDPIDGTRAAKSGFEGCVVAVASTRVIERPRMADVDNACVMEIIGDRVFCAQRGKGARIHVNGHVKRPKLSTNADLESVSWSMTVPARPAELIFPTAAKLIDLSSLKGGFFACNSTSYSLTRLLTNQLDACVDFANRYLRDIPEVVRDHFINAGRGTVLGIAPYDMAAGLLVAQEAGCIVTDAYGHGFDDVLLLDSGELNHRSMIAASNPELHDKLMSFFDTRINQFELLLKRRAGKAD